MLIFGIMLLVRLGVENSGEIRDKVEKELEPDTIVKMQVASRKRYKEFTKEE